MICFVVLVSAIILLAVVPSVSTGSEGAGLIVQTNEERLQYLQSLGYQVSNDQPEIREILIPDEFDEVFEQYNAVQKTANMDLKPYHGKRIKCYAYKVVNYPQQENVLAHLYIYKDKIVGGDICSTELNGFMHGLFPLSSPETSAVITTTSVAKATTTATKK